MVIAEMFAFDKYSDAIYQRTLSANTSEEADRQYEEFKSDIPFEMYQLQVELLSDNNPQTMDIMFNIDYV